MRSTTCICRRPWLEEVERQIAVLAEATAGADLVAVVGAPIRSGDALFNCAVVMGGGEVLGVVPKTYLPNYREYYEKRWFAPATARTEDVVRLNGETVDFAPGLIFEAANRPGFRLRRRDLRGLLGAPAALDAGGAGGGAHPAEPVGVQHRHRQGGRAGDAGAPAIRRAPCRPMSSPPRAGARAPPTWPGTGRRQFTNWGRNWRKASGSPWTAT